MLRSAWVFLAAALFLFVRPVYAGDTLTPEQQATVQKYRAIVESLHPRSGLISIGAANSHLALGSSYYFLDANEAKRVLIEGWDNPPSAVSGVLGMVFPAGKTFLDNTWGAVITYSQSGYISDADAKSANYSSILKQKQDSEDATNEERKKGGYPTIYLIGWALPPSYNKANHSLIWAQEIRFGDQNIHTLNYDLRLLGRRGFVSVNIISDMTKVTEISSVAQDLSKIILFDRGSRYIDFIPGTDLKADYGLAGLVAAGIGVVALKKVGLIALGLLFFKKFAALLLIPILAVIGLVKKAFRRTPKS